MIGKKVKIITCSLVALLSFIVCFMMTKPVSAALIDGVTYLRAKGCGNHNNSVGTTEFDVTFNWGSSCRSATCDEVDSEATANVFHCTKAGAACPTEANVTGVSSSYSHTSNGWDYYNVTISVQDGYQPVDGQVKKRQTFIVKTVAKDYNGKATLKNPVKEKEKAYGKDVTISGAYSKSGYYFYKWGTSCPHPDNDNIKCTVKNIKRDHTINVYYRRRATLTAYAKDSASGADLNDGNPISTAQTNGENWVWWEDSATVSSANFNPTGYTWKAWDINGGLCNNSTSRSCTEDSATDDKQTNAYYDKNTFEGQSILSGDASATVGYNTTGGYAIGYINNCSPITGCKASFKHNIKRSLGSGTTSYSVTRTSNLTVSDRAVSAGTVVATRDWNQVNNEVSSTGPFTLYPGMIVCETLTFKPYNVPNTADVTSTVCVSALGNAQPPDPPTTDTPEPPDQPINGDNAFVNIKVKNPSIAKYSKYMREVYAKPGHIEYDSEHRTIIRGGDTVTFRASYNPVLQYTYFIVPENIKIDGGREIGNSSQQLGRLFNQHKGGLQPWNNAFSILDTTRGLISDHKYESGKYSRQSPDPNSRTVIASNVGSSINETARTSHNTNTQTTPSQVAFSKYGDNSHIGNVVTASVERTAYVRIPYNFNNTTKMNIPTSRIYYAGEAAQAETVITVNPRYNSVTDGTYATYVRNAKWKLRLCHDGVCNETAELSPSNDNTLNKNGNIAGSDNPKIINFNVPDLPAGTEICLSTAVYPANSGAETNWDNPAGSGTWSNWSSPACFLVAKRPSLQAWGGNVFSGGSMNAGLAQKKLLYGYTDNADASTNINPHTNAPYVFSSWGELGVVSEGPVRGFASGATLGYVSNNNGTLNPIPFASTLASSPNTRSSVGNNPGGSRQSNFCKNSVLTFANDDCSGGTASGTGGKDASEGVKVDVEALKALADPASIQASQKQEVSGTARINSGVETGSDDGIVLYHSANDLNLQGGDLARGTFKVVSSDRNIDITNNIYVRDGETFQNFRQVPKAVVYAADTIYIGCNVTHIDAVLIANRVVTCKNLDTTKRNLKDQVSAKISSKDNSNQLIVTGAIVAGKLYANRTYGAARGANSIVPGEIVDFDPTLYLWGGSSAGSDDNNGFSGDMEVTYMHELAPRQ